MASDSLTDTSGALPGYRSEDEGNILKVLMKCGAANLMWGEWVGRECLLSPVSCQIQRRTQRPQAGSIRVGFFQTCHLSAAIHLVITWRNKKKINYDNPHTNSVVWK